MISWLKRLWNNRRGSVAPVFALMALPMTMVAGFSIDLARAYEGHAKLQQGGGRHRPRLGAPAGGDPAGDPGRPGPELDQRRPARHRPGPAGGG
ncbi:MAG: pilus assembly protein TadG-related protein [Caulobacteraceae bacterium]